MTMNDASIEFLCEVNRFMKLIRNQLNKQRILLMDRQISKINSLCDRMDKVIKNYCDELQIEMLDYSGIEYEIGLPVDPLNLDDFEEKDIKLYINMMIEPVIKEKGASVIIHNGKVILSDKKESF